MDSSWINGKAQTNIPLNDRGFLYGDGFFTTAVVREGQILLKELHLQRLREAGQRLFIDLDIEKLTNDLDTFLAASAAKAGSEKDSSEKVTGDRDAILKVIVTRKHSRRGYHYAGNRSANIILQGFPFSQADKDSLLRKQQQGLCIYCAEKRISENPDLAGIKHLSKLDHVLIASGIDTSRFDEALVLDKHDNVIEGLASNVFIFSKDKTKLVLTPDLKQAGVEGVMRKYLLEQFLSAGFEVKVTHVSMFDVLKSPAIFMSSCVLGFCKVNSISGIDWFADSEFENRVMNVLDMSSVSL